MKRDVKGKTGAAEPRKLADLLIGRGFAGDARIVERGRELDRAAAIREAGRLSASLKTAGVRRGHKVLALLDHDMQGFLFLGVASALGIHVYMPYNLQTAAVAEWTSIVASAQPDFIVHLKRDDGALAELASLGRPLVTLADVGEEQARLVVEHPEPVRGFLILFSSGTTGNPKAISISEDLVVRRVRSATDVIAMDATSRPLMTGLLNNTTGFIFCFGAMLHGATLIFPRSGRVEDWPADVAEHAVSHLMLRPVAMRRFLEAAEKAEVDLSSLRTLAYGAAAMPADVLERGRRLITCDWVQGYGLSETFGPFCWLDEQGHAERRYATETYCVGRPDGTLEVKIDPVVGHSDGIGEVLVRGENLMEGYLDVQTGEAHRDESAWLRTGDLGRWSTAGDLILKGRLHGTVLSENGHRIYPEEVEATLAGMPGVDTAVVVGLEKSDRTGQLPVACISGPLGAEQADVVRGRVMAFLESTLSAEKWPDYVYSDVNPFPVSANGKVARAQVTSALAWENLIRVSDRDALS